MRSTNAPTDNFLKTRLSWPGGRRIDPEVERKAGSKPVALSPRAFVGSLLAFLGLAALDAAVLARAVGSIPGAEVLPWSYYFLQALPRWLAWWLALPGVAWLSQRFPVVGGLPLRSGVSRLGIHVVSGTMIGWLVSFSSLAGLRSMGSWGRQGSFWDLADQSFLLGTREQLLIYAALVTGFTLLHHQRETARREASLEADLLETRLEGLRARLQPHFLFNTLTAVSGLMGRDVGAARSALAQLADLLRGVLDEGDSQVPLEEELDLVERYVSLLRLRFGERLRLEIDAPEQARSLGVPKLILQPLVENAVVHGVERRRESGRIQVSARLDADPGGGTAEHRLVLRVEDDGPGPAGEAKVQEGLGIRTTRARLETWYGDRAGVRLSRAAKGGAMAEVWLPAERWS